MANKKMIAKRKWGGVLISLYFDFSSLLIPPCSAMHAHFPLKPAHSLHQQPQYDRNLVKEAQYDFFFRPRKKKSDTSEIFFSSL